jgi:hypothetical protein
LVSVRPKRARRRSPAENLSDAILLGRRYSLPRFASWGWDATRNGFDPGTAFQVGGASYETCEERTIPLDAEEIAVPGYDLNQIDYHLTQIRKSGYIDEGGARPMLGIGFRCLNPAGHDFLDSVRDPETWAKTKKTAAKAGGFTLDLLKDIAKGLIKKKIEDHTGIKL